MSPKIHPSIARVNARLAQVRALFPPTTFLILPVADELRGEIFDDNDQPFLDLPYELDAPVEVEPIDTTTTPAALDFAESLSLAAQIAALDDAHFLALNIDADRAERDELRAKIAQWEAEELDARQCGLGGDWSAEIEAAADRIDFLDKRLEGSDIAADIAAVAAPECPYQRAGIAAAANEARRLSFPFWRHHDARAAEMRESERDLIRCRDSNAATIQRRNRFQREVPCTPQQVKFIEFLAGGDAAALIDHLPRELRMSQAGLLIEWLKSGRPDA